MAISYKNTSLKSTNVRFKNRILPQISRFLFTTAWAVSSSLTKKAIMRMFFRPVSYEISKDQEKLLSQAEKFRFKSGGKQICAYKWGQGPAVLFVHGWAGQGIQFHRYIERLVSGGYSVIAFDHAGHGNSQGKTANYFKFSNAVYDLCEHLSALDIGIHAIVAHSLGASATINTLWRTKKRPVTVFIAPALHLIEMLDQTFERYGLPDYIFKSIIDDIGHQTNHTFSKENPIDLLKTLTHDIMILHDAKDRAVAYEDSWNASVIQNNISLVPTKGLGHIRILEDDALIDLVVKKIAKKGQIIPLQPEENNTVSAAPCTC